MAERKVKGLSRRGKVYWMSYNANGKRYRESTKTCNLKLAQQILAKRKTEIAENRFLDKRNQETILFEDFAAEYLTWLGKRAVAPSTCPRYRICVNNLMPRFRGVALSDITPKMVEDFKSDREQKLIGKTKRISTSTINRDLAIFRRMLNMAIKWGKLETNPLEKVDFYKERVQERRILTMEEEDRLLAHCLEHWLPVVIAALDSGMRKSEIMSLTWDKVDFDARTVTVSAERAKSKRFRVIPMTSRLTAALESIRVANAKGYVFCRSDGDPLGNIRKAFDTAVRRAGIPFCRFHDLRHTYASRLVMAGVDLVTVKELLGHADIQTTMRYSHISGGHKKEAVRMLDLRRNSHNLGTIGDKAKVAEPVETYK